MKSKRLYTAHEAAEYVGCAYRTIGRYGWEGRLPVAGKLKTKGGAANLYAKEDLDRLKKERQKREAMPKQSRIHRVNLTKVLSEEADPIRRLAAGVVACAYDDYRYLLSGPDRTIPIHFGPQNGGYTLRETAEDVEDFFYSEWFHGLTDGAINPEYIIKEARRITGHGF